MSANATQPARRGIRSWHIVLAACAVCVGAPAVLAAASGTGDAPATAASPADRLWPLSSGGLLFPIEPTPMCEFLNNFGQRRSTHSHQGVDIGALGRDDGTVSGYPGPAGYLGQEVYAVEDAVVYERDDSDDGSAGIAVRLEAIDHDVQYRYYHLAAIAPEVIEGGTVRQGQVIGWVGDTGNATHGGWHLHFEVRPGPDHAPVDPAPLLAIPSVCNVYGTITPVDTVPTTVPPTTVPLTTVPGTTVPETSVPESSVPGSTPA